ncbi:MAG: glycosyltransferase [Candidatus Roizmanbacteria bacterium]
MKIALVHDHLLEFGGAERVLVAFKRIFPEADVYVAAYKPEVVKRWIPDFKSWKVHTSWASHIPFYNKLYSPLRFLTPWIWESFDLSGYDVVLSSSGWFMSKGVITKPHTRHISYIHHPPSYLYFYQTAIEWQKYWLVKVYAHFINHFLRMWDFTASQRPDVLVSNSQETQGRIRKFYRRDAQVIYPPVEISSKEPEYTDKKDYYITLSRIAFKKHIDVLIKAANEKKFNLKIIGTGRDEGVLKALAGPTVEFMGHVSDQKRDELLSGAKAFLNASVEEEFGIAPVEAMGYGVPVIAFSSGGLKETVINGKNGYLYEELSAQSLNEAIEKLEKLTKEEYKVMCMKARKESEKYSAGEFEKKIKALVYG